MGNTTTVLYGDRTLQLRHKRAVGLIADANALLIAGDKRPSRTLAWLAARLDAGIITGNEAFEAARKVQLGRI